MSILRELQLPSDTMASIRTSGLIGDKFVALAPGAEEDLLQPSERIIMTESAVELESLISKMAFGSVQEGEAAEQETMEEKAIETP
jgi:phospholipid/cholesterol/gamma-HCH transport system substrate-binding protein